MTNETPPPLGGPEEHQPKAELYLVAHKVRNEPAFDIAQRVACCVCEGTQIKTIGNAIGEACDNCDNGFEWIIPTSGHRAYPYWHLELAAIILWWRYGTSKDHVLDIPPMPPGHPDHYSCNDRTLALQPAAKIDLRALGLVKPKPAIDRRI